MRHPSRIRHVILCLVTTACAVASRGEPLDAFEARRLAAFERTLKLSLPSEPKPAWQNRTSQGPEWRRWAIPRLQRSLIQLFLDRDVSAANDLLKVTFDTLAPDTSRFTGGPSGLHWSGAMMVRLHALFGPNGTLGANRLSPESLHAMERLLWRWCELESRMIEADPRRVWESWASENHGAMRVALCWGATGVLAQSPDFRDRQFPDGFSPREHYAAWTEYAKQWLRERGQRGLLVEIAANHYSAVTLQTWHNYVDCTVDSDLQRLARNLLHLWWADAAQEMLDGQRGGSKAREARGRGGDWNGFSDNVTAMAWFYLGMGGPPAANIGELMTMLTGSYRLPPVIAELALDRVGCGSFVYESRRPGLLLPQYSYLPQKPGIAHQYYYWLDRDHGGIRRYSYVTPDYVVGCSMIPNLPIDRWAKISDQNRWSGIILQGSPEARVFAQCDAGVPDRYGNARGSNEHWTLQDENTLIWQKLRRSKNSLRTKLYVPPVLQRSEENGVIFARFERTFVALRPAIGGYQKLDERWLVLDDEFSPVIFEVGSVADYGSFERFRDAVLASKATIEDGTLHYVRSRDGRRFTFYHGSDRTGEIDGRPIDFDPPFTYRSPFIEGAWPAKHVTIRKGNAKLELDF